MRHSSGHDPRTAMSESALEAANRIGMPAVVGDTSDRMTTMLGAAALLMLGVFVFNQLSEGRRAASIDEMMAETRTELEQARMNAEAARNEAARARADADNARRLASSTRAAPAPPPQTALAPTQANLRSPALVVDNSQQFSPDPVDAATGAQAGPDGMTASDVFARRVASGGLEPVRATVIQDPSRVAPQGTIVAGVLETAINSDLPGFTRAIVSENVRSLDNSEILIPRGSRLIGQYRSGLAIGESRAFVIWTRLITPKGVSIELASPATDTLGRAGLSGSVDRHFFQRFGSAILLSLIGVGTNALVLNQDTEIIIASTSEAQAVASQALAQQMNIPPTIKVPQGSEIRIFLARDLYFPRLGDADGLRP